MRAARPEGGAEWRRTADGLYIGPGSSPAAPRRTRDLDHALRRLADPHEQAHPGPWPFPAAATAELEERHGAAAARRYASGRTDAHCRDG
jgi:hypothetical protein